RAVEGNDARRPRLVHAVEQQQLDPGCVLREHAEVDALCRGAGSQRRTTAFLGTVDHCLPSSSRAAAATRTCPNPNFSFSAFRGADAPNVFMPMTRPAPPT